MPSACPCSPYCHGCADGVRGHAGTKLCPTAADWVTSCPCSRGTRPCWRRAPTARSPGSRCSASCTAPCTARPFSVSTGFGTWRRTPRSGPGRSLQAMQSARGGYEYTDANLSCPASLLGDWLGRVLGVLPAATAAMSWKEATATRVRSRRAIGIPFIFSCLARRDLAATLHW